MTSHDGRSRKATSKTQSTKEQKMKSFKFFKPTLATTLAIVLAWLLSVRAAQAGYTVTLQQVGPNVVATGSGAIDLTGLTLSSSSQSVNPALNPVVFIYTGPTSSSVDVYDEPSGPTRFGGGGLFSSTSSASSG